MLHSNNIVHRDLKPDNLLVTPDFKVKLIDFGLSKDYTNEVLMTKAGSTPYMAPEIFNNNVYDEKCDIWSIGIILY